MKIKGFTIIELLVVVAIIALLTSVISALIGEARDDARAQGFRQNVDQFIKALEIYRADRNFFPGQPNTFFYYQTGGNTSPQDQNTNLPTVLADYIQEIPVPPSGAYFYYYYDPDITCYGDTSNIQYAILIESIQPGFEDWPGYSYAGGAEDTSYRCFSIK